MLTTLPSLIYSTELARSIKLAYASPFRVDESNEIEKPTGTKSQVGATEPPLRPLQQTPLSRDLVYGLVNVRTDGGRVLCATLESGTDFDVKVFR